MSEMLDPPNPPKPAPPNELLGVAGNPLAPLLFTLNGVVSANPPPPPMFPSDAIRFCGFLNAAAEIVFVPMAGEGGVVILRGDLEKEAAGDGALVPMGELEYSGGVR